jgi:S1-C subfamily serine protease
VVSPSRWGANGANRIVAVCVLAASLITTLSSDSRPGNHVAPTADEARIASVIEPKIVDITFKLAYPPAREGWATGVIIDRAGDVLTNNHVVAGTQSLTLQVETGGPFYRGKVLATDVVDDLALVRMVGAHDLEPAVFGNSARLTIGQQVCAIGNNMAGCDIPRASCGVVRGLHRTSSVAHEVNGDRLALTNLILSRARAQGGYSGGPLVDANGRVVGIIAAGDCAASCGYNHVYAIPIAKAAAIAGQMRAGISSAVVHVGPTASLGLAAAPAFDDAAAPVIVGAPITYLAPGSPAESLGLRVGDRILSINRSPVRSALDLVRSLQPHQPGDRVRVGWVDCLGQRRSGQVTLGAGPPD